MTEPIDKRAAILRWIEEQEALCEKATPEAWSLRPCPSGAEIAITARVPDWRGQIIDGHLATVHVYEDGRQEEWRANAALFAASRSVLPLALAALRAETMAHDYNGMLCGGCSWPTADGVACPTIERLFCSLGLQDSGR